MNQPPGSHGSEQELYVPKSCNKHKIESKSMNAPSKPRNTKRERGRGGDSSSLNQSSCQLFLCHGYIRALIVTYLSSSQ